MLRRLAHVRWIVLAAIALVAVTVMFLVPTAAPWEETGRVIITAHATRDAGSAVPLRIGIDDIYLARDDGSRVRLSVLSRRAQLEDARGPTQTIVDRSVPVGSYTNITFTLTSPETNADVTSIDTLDLMHKFVTLPVSLVVTPDQTTAILLALETERALHLRDGVGTYLPNIQVETRTNVTVLDVSGGVAVDGGEITDSAMYGMDWDGTMRHNFRARDDDGTAQDVLPDGEPWSYESAHAAAFREDATPDEASLVETREPLDEADTALNADNTEPDDVSLETEEAVSASDETDVPEEL